jgi:hypothetical protein
MAFYNAAVVVRWLDAPVPTVTARHGDDFTVVFAPVAEAVSYEFTTDGWTWLPIVSGVAVTTDSAGALLVANTHYPVQVHAVGSGGNIYDTSSPSTIVDAYTNPVTPPVMVMLTAYPTEDATIWLLRAYINDWGTDVVTIEFHYGLTGAYGSTALVAGSYGNKTIGQVYVKLTANKTYHVQVRGTNMGGFTDSADTLLQTSSDVRWRIYEDVI